MPEIEEEGRWKREDFQVEMTSVSLWAQTIFGKMKWRLALESRRCSWQPL